MVKTNIQTFTGEVEILSNLHVGPSGSSYLTANGAASNVLDITGNVGATFFVGDGGFLSNIATTLSDIVNQGNTVSNVVKFEANTHYAGIGIVTESNVGIQNTAPTHTLSIGDKIRIDNNTNESLGESVMQVDGRIVATRFKGDGGLLSNIATTLESIVNQGNVSANVVKFSSNSLVSEFAGVGIITDSNVGIQNTAPTHNLSIGSNVHVNDTGANVLTVHGNVVASNINMGVFSIVPAYGLNDVCNTSNGTTNVVQFQNGTTSLVASSNITASGNITAQTIISTANVEITDRLKFDGNVFVDTLRVADVAANIVTYDRTTGELLDSSGTFMNKFAVVSEQPPSDLFANTTTVTNHGGYTLTTSNLATNSNTYNAFDGTANAWVSGGLEGGYIGGSNVFKETNLTQLSNLHPTQFGDWLAIEFPYKTTLRHMKLTPLTAAQFPARANVYATNNDITWSEVKYWGSVTDTSLDLNPVTDSNVQTITVNATEQFKKYALVATKAAGNSSNVAIQDWQLFTESFSIDGGKVAMAQQAATGGETVMDQSGPHSRLPKTVPLKKYPESHITFNWNTMEKFHNTTTGVGSYYIPGGGYKVSASSVYSQSSSSEGGAYGLYAPWKVFDRKGWQDPSIERYGWLSDSGKYSSSDGSVGSADTTTYNGSSTATGEWLELKLPKKIKLKSFSIVSMTHNSSDVQDRMPKTATLLGSNDGSTWSLINDVSLGIPTEGVWINVDVNATEYYKYIRFVVTSTHADGTPAFTDTGFTELEYYGYEEDLPAGDTSVDTTFTSIMNTPQTTGANVYVDGSLGETFTNRVPGLLDSNISNTHTTYVSAGKYWELSGNVESNVTVEANTFLSGDAPHSVSVWFNSSNLEANTANTCVFSISDQEKLDSVNLDLQSNTWHNLTYAYQGEGGSRVTYLDGRKVAEDQAEDTFGDYPPFAMTGYSQGGYVVSVSSEVNQNQPAWYVFDNGTDTVTGTYWQSSTGTYSGGNWTGSTVQFTDTSGGQHSGEWIKLEMPHKLKLDYISYLSTYDAYMPKDFVILGSNDDTTWTLLKSVTGGASVEDVYHSLIVNANHSYKYFVWLTSAIQGSSPEVVITEIKFYGHRENDLVRLPDPTNVLKYPHIAMTTETTTVQGPQINPGMPGDRGYEIIYSNHGGTPTLPSRAFNGITNSATDPESSWVTSGFTYNAGDGALASGQTHALTIDGTSRGGSWLGMKMPRKLKLSSVVYWPRHGYNWEIYNGYVVGSNDGISWDSLLTISAQTGWAANTPKTFTMTNNLNTYYQYFAILATHVQSNNTDGRFAIQELEFYGTEEATPVPIQIGGGNIDKVANFRVYDKFIDENQALEIWDAQKDTFREVKNSMTLHKGRLGIGTMEPEGRLAVLDEPHNLEEFLPRAMSDDKTYIEGHGEFCTSASNIFPNAYAYKAFNKIQSGSGLDFHWSEDDPGSYDNVTGAYTGSSNYFTNVEGQIKLGQWIQIEFPYKINYRYSEIQGPDHAAGRQPHTGYIVGSNDLSGVWTSLHNYSGMTRTGVRDFITYIPPIVSTQTFKYIRLVIEKMGGGNTHAGVSQWRIFGTREQGQSVLHDGQLTLTKNLTVPRIGPALDADDTPRRDRLVVEYNTSTNPTFEGAVRDTSGRGLDGVFYGGASYDATEKALVFDGNGDYIDRELPSEFTGDPTITISMWIKPTSLPTASGSYDTYIHLGQNSTDDQLQITYYGYDQSYLQIGGFGQGVQTQNSSALPVGQWTHVCAVVTPGAWSTTNKKLYINGQYYPTVLSGSGTTSIPPASGTSRLVIGAVRTSAYDHYADAKLSSIKLYDTALTAEEVKTLYDMGRCDEGHHVVNFSKTRVGIGLGDGEAPQATLDVRGDIRYISMAPIALPTLYDHILAGRNGRGIYPILGTNGGTKVYNVYCEPDIYGGGWMCFAQVPRIPDRLVYNIQGRNWSLFTDEVGNSAVLLKPTGGTGARRHSTFSVPMNILSNNNGFNLDVLLMAYGDALRYNGTSGAKCSAIWRGVNLSQAFNSEHATDVGTSGLASSADGVDFTSRSYSLYNMTGWDFSISTISGSGEGSYGHTDDSNGGYIVHNDITSGGYTLYSNSIRGSGGSWTYAPSTGWEYVRFFVRPSSF